MPQIHPIIVEFQNACQKHFICYILANKGMNSFRQRFAKAQPGNRIFISPKDPALFPATASMFQLELFNKLKPDGEFADALAKAFLVEIYSDWDEYFRPHYAKVHNAKKNNIQCDLMGDLRRIRNCIIDDRSILEQKDINMKCLNWHLNPGPLQVTQEMFSTFVEQANNLEVVISE